MLYHFKDDFLFILLLDSFMGMVEDRLLHLLVLNNPILVRLFYTHVTSTVLVLAYMQMKI